MEIVNVNTENCLMTRQNSNFREHSRNLLESGAGAALELVSEQKGITQTLDSELPSNTSKYREHSQESRNSTKLIDMEMARKLVKRTISGIMHWQHSECPEHSQNSRVKQPGLIEATANVEDFGPTAADSDFFKTFSKLAVER